jgi:hypothetical protein
MVLFAGPAQAERRVALVIGNSDYRNAAPLANPVNDAQAMAAKLTALGFEVILRKDATKAQMEDAVGIFGEKLTADATGLLFYAGHGIQVAGRNYLVPVDAKLASEQRVKLETVDAEVVLDQMAAARTKVSLVILDACRNNPFERRFRSTSGGLAQMNAPEGTLVAYATAPGKVANDGDGRNGLYTGELLKVLGEPGLPVEEVFKRVRVAVSKASNGGQTPWESSSLVGDLYFVPKGTQAMAAPAVPAEPSRQAMELAFWQTVQNGSDRADFEEYLRKYPKGEFAALAQRKLKGSKSVAKPTETATLVAPPTAVQPSRPADPSSAPDLKPNDNPVLNTLRRNMVRIAPGRFVMGSSQ